MIVVVAVAVVFVFDVVHGFFASDVTFDDNLLLFNL